MNEKIALLGAVEILSSLSCGIVVLFASYKIMRRYGKRKLKIDHTNTAFNIVIAAVLFSVGFIVSGVIQPILDSFRMISATKITNLELSGRFIGYGGLYILIASACAFIITILGATIYHNMTRIDEKKELKENNIGIAIVLSTIIITLSMMSSNGIALLIESLIPYPELPPKIG